MKVKNKIILAFIFIAVMGGILRGVSLYRSLGDSEKHVLEDA